MLNLYLKGWVNALSEEGTKFIIFLGIATNGRGRLRIAKST
jgi:hypothetical protein